MRSDWWILKSGIKESHRELYHSTTLDIQEAEMRSIALVGLILACCIGLSRGSGYGGNYGYGYGGGQSGGYFGILLLLFFLFILFFNKSDDVQAINILPPPQTGLG